MEPVTTTAMIGTVVGYLAKKLKDNKSIQDFFSDFTEATVNWIRPLFITNDEKPREVLQDLQADPVDKINTVAAENAIAKALKKDPGAGNFLKEMFDIIQDKEASGESISINTSNIFGDNNTVVQGVKSGGDTNITIDKTDNHGR